MPLNCFGKKGNNATENPVLAVGWEEFWDPRYGTSYFVNRKEKKTQWEHPGYSTKDGKKIELMESEEIKPEDVKWNKNSNVQKATAEPIKQSEPNGEYKSLILKCSLHTSLI